MRLFSPLLLIDIGNTFAKLHRARQGALVGKVRRVPTASLVDEYARATALRAWRYDRVVLCSVVPTIAQRVQASLPKYVTSLAVNPAMRGLPVDLSRYPQRRTLGADRLANMVGALALHGEEKRPLIVVDFGTAATFNVLDEKACFLGGIIAPGLGSMSHYLFARGSQLPQLDRVQEVPASPIGRSTRAAMRVGTVLGYRGLVRELLTSLREKTPGSLVVATGGDAEFVAGLLPEIIQRVEPLLTMHGLRIIAEAGQDDR